MKMTIDIITTFLLIIWGGCVMMSPMMIAAKGFKDRASSILFGMLILGYPLLIFLGYKALGWNFWGLKTNTLLIVLMIVIFAIFQLYGFPRMLINLNKGIPNSGYFITNNKVYLEGEAIPYAEAASFEILEKDQWYARDKNHVFYNGKIVENANPVSFAAVNITRETDDFFEDIKPEYWADHKHVFRSGKMLEKSDAKSFQYKGPFGWDSENVYYLGERLVKSSPRHFRVLKDGLALDSNSVIVYGAYSSQQVDQASFEVIGDGNEMYCRDKNHIYLILLSLKDPLVKVEGADVNTFTPLERSYAIDKNNVYYYGNDDKNTYSVKVLKGANPTTFKVGYDAKKASDASDGIRLYMNGEAL